MKQLTLLSIAALLMLSACAPSAEAVQTAIAQTQAAAGMSDTLTNRLNRLLEAGATLNAMTMQGFTFEDFERQLAQAKGDYSLALSAQSQSSSIPPEAVTELNAAFTGWDLTRSVWDAQLNGGGAPQAPDAVRYPELVEYVGLDKLPFVGGVPGEGPVDPDQVIRILLYQAMEHFGRAQDVLLAAMRQG
jgi:hypothetical protein